MATDFFNEWVQELRTGNRVQGTGRLHEVREEGTEAFCCLGVAEDMLCERKQQVRSRWDAVEADEEGYGQRPAQYAYGLDEETGVLTPVGRKALGFDENNPRFWLTNDDDDVLISSDYRPACVTVAELNDAGLTFDQMADVLDYFFGGDK